MRLSRRGLILGGASVALAGCGTTQRLVEMSDPLTPSAIQTAALEVAPPVIEPVSAGPVMDPQGLIPTSLRERALEALDHHAGSIWNRDRMYVVNFSAHSAQARMVELDLISGEARAIHTSHGTGSDPAHTGFAQGFSNTPNSNASSVGAYRTAGQGWGARHGQNVLLDGLDPTNSNARDRAIIVHAADYCEPEFLAREGKLGRSFGCFATSFADLAYLRPRMAEGRLLYAGIAL